MQFVLNAKGANAYLMAICNSCWIRFKWNCPICFERDVRRRESSVLLGSLLVSSDGPECESSPVFRRAASDWDGDRRSERNPRCSEGRGRTIGRKRTQEENGAVPEGSPTATVYFELAPHSCFSDCRCLLQSYSACLLVRLPIRLWTLHVFTLNSPIVLFTSNCRSFSKLRCFPLSCFSRANLS